MGKFTGNDKFRNRPRLHKVEPEPSRDEHFPNVPSYIEGTLAENMITLLAFSDKHCRKVMDAVPVQLFSNAVQRTIVQHIYNYVAKQCSAPKEHLPDICEKETDGKDAELYVGQLENIHALYQGGFNEDFVNSQTSRFIRQQRDKEFTFKIIEATEAGDTDRVAQLTAEHQAFQRTHSPLRGVILGTADASQAKPITWIWRGWLARGKLHLLAGPPGTGKSSIVLGWAASFTNPKRPFPDGSRVSEPMHVIIYSNEDDWEDTLLPRLIAAGANLDYVHPVIATNDGKRERDFDPATDMALLEAAVAEIDGPIGLVMIDSVAAVVGGGRDSNKSNEVRDALKPLVRFGQRLGAVVVGVTHVTKHSKGQDPMERVLQSVAFAAVSRVVLMAFELMVPDFESEATAILVRAKNNIGPKGGGFLYRKRQVPLLEHNIEEAQKIVWDRYMDGSPYDLVAWAEERGATGKVNDVDTFVREMITDGKNKQKEIVSEGAKRGFSEAQINRAGGRLDVHKGRDGFGPGSTCYWDLPKVKPSGDEKESS